MRAVIDHKRKASFIKCPEFPDDFLTMGEAEEQTKINIKIYVSLKEKVVRFQSPA